MSTAVVTPNSYWMGALVLILLDQLSKALVRSLSAPIVIGDLSLGAFLNQNGFLSLQVPNGVLIALGAVVVTVLFFWLVVSADRPTALLGIWLMLAGAVSNLLDRIFYGGVVDIISISWLSHFNLADVLILLGAATWLVGMIRPKQAA